MFDTGILITGAIGLVTTVVSSLTTWFLSRKKYNVEVSHDEIVNMKESLDFYKTLSESNQRTLTEILEKSEDLTNTNIKLLMEIQNLKIQNGIFLQIIISELGDVDLSKYGIQIENGVIIRQEISEK